MARVELRDLRPYFSDACTLVAGLSSLPVWPSLRRWPSVNWLAIYHANAVTPGGVRQQRRIAAYLTAALLPSAREEAGVALGVYVHAHVSVAHLLVVAAGHHVKTWYAGQRTVRERRCAVPHLARTALRGAALCVAGQRLPAGPDQPEIQ